MKENDAVHLPILNELVLKVCHVNVIAMNVLVSNKKNYSKKNNFKINLQMYVLTAFFISIITKPFCVSVSDWLGYSYFDNIKEDPVYCVVSHLDKTVTISDTCEQNIPKIECYNDTKT